MIIWEIPILFSSNHVRWLVVTIVFKFGLNLPISETFWKEAVCQWFAAGRWFSPGTPVSSTNKTDRHDITEILLKVALCTIPLTTERRRYMLWYSFNIGCILLYLIVLFDVFVESSTCMLIGHHVPSNNKCLQKIEFWLANSLQKCWLDLSWMLMTLQD